MTSPLSLCTGARPEICLSPKNIRIPTQEGWLGSSAARAEGQRAGGEERRGKDSRGVKRRGKESVFFWAASQQPDSDRSASRLVPSVQWSRARGDCPVIGTALSIRKMEPEHSRVQIPRLCVDFCFDLKPSQIQKISNYTQTKSSYIKNPNKTLEMNTNNE